MRFVLTLVVLAASCSFGLFSCVTHVEEPPNEPVADGQRECWVDEECAIVREVSGCCAGCAGVVARTLADTETCLVEEGQDTPAACWDVGCPAEPACGDACLDPVGAECVRGQCLALFDCDADQTAPLGTFCRD
jgi:hypothetical protein